MRGLRSTIALLVALAGVSAYIYFVTWKKTDTDTGTKLDKVFPSIQIDKIDDLKVKSESGDMTSLKKVPAGGWHLEAPVSDKGDEPNISGITSNLGTVEISRVLDENPAGLKDYGLDPPRIEIDFKASGDKDYQKLLIGEKSPTGAQLFAKRNDEKRVFLIPAFEETTFNRSTFDLRDKALLTFDREKVDGLDLASDAKTLQIAKEGSDWNIKKPVQAKADYGSVEGLVGRLAGAQMKSIIAPSATPADLKKYSLDKPAMTVNVSSGSSRATLLIGGKTADGMLYASDTSRPLVFAVESALVDDLKKGADDYRRKDLFEMRPYNTNRLDLTRDGQTIVFEMTKGAADAPNKWRRVSPNPADLAQDKADAFLSKLSNLRAASFVDSNAKTGLDKPVLTVRGKFQDTKEDLVNFGRVGNDVYAGHPGESGVAKLDSNDFNDAIKALDEVAK